MSYHRKLSGEYEYAYFMDSQIYKVNVIDESSDDEIIDFFR